MNQNSPTSQSTSETGIGSSLGPDDMALLGENRSKLAVLEQGWSLLGPLREITFCAVIYMEDDVEPFAEAAEAHGFSVSRWRDGGFWHIEATKPLEPKPEIVTHWELWFTDTLLAIP